MLKVVCFCLFVFITVQGHSNTLQEDADLQSALMPQELNPDIVSEKDQPWKAVMPIVRARRDLVQDPGSVEVVSYTSNLKRYSRIMACVVLVMSAIVEIVLYALDFYMS